MISFQSFRILSSTTALWGVLREAWKKMIFSVLLPLEFLTRTTGCGTAHFLRKTWGSIYTGRAGCPFISVSVTIPQMVMMLCVSERTGFNVRQDQPHSGARTSGQMSQLASCFRRHCVLCQPQTFLGLQVQPPGILSRSEHSSEDWFLEEIMVRVTCTGLSGSWGF